MYYLFMISFFYFKQAIPLPEDLKLEKGTLENLSVSLQSIFRAIK